MLINIWSIVGYYIFTLIIEFSADISFKILKSKINLVQKLIAGLSGVAISLTYFGIIIIALYFFFEARWAASSSKDPDLSLVLLIFV